MMSNDSLAKEITERLQMTNIMQPLTGLAMQTLKPWMTLKCGIRIDLETGEVTVPESLELTEAAKAFWEAVQRVSGYRAPGFW